MTLQFFLMRVERLFNYHKLSRNPKQVMYLMHPTLLRKQMAQESEIIYAVTNQYIRDTEIIK